MGYLYLAFAAVYRHFALHHQMVFCRLQRANGDNRIDDGEPFGSQSISACPCLQPCLSRVGRGNVIGDGTLARQAGNFAGVIRRTLVLLHAVHHGQVVVRRLHRPYRIALRAESQFGIGAYARVDNHGLALLIEDEGAYIVVVVALVVMPALGGKDIIALLKDTHLCLGIPCLVQGLSFRFLRLLVGQHLVGASQARQRTVDIRTIGDNPTALLCKSVRQRLHLIAMDSLPVAEKQRGDIVGETCGGIGKIDHPSIAYISVGKVLAHGFHLRIAPEVYLPVRHRSKHIQVVKQFAGSVSPIGGSFLAGTVCLHVVHELIHALHRPPYAAVHHLFIVLREHHHLQHIAVAPRVPVVHHLPWLQMKRQPPLSVPRQVRHRDALVQRLFQPRRNNGVHLIKLLMEEIVCPCQERRHLAAA